MKALVLLVAAFLVGLGSYIGYLSWTKATINIQDLSVAADCYLNEGPCLASHQDIHIHAQLYPQPIPLMQPVKLQLKSEHFADITNVAATVEGINMFMGIQPITFKAPPTTAESWQGDFILPICSESHMQWRLTLTFTAKQQAYRAIWLFDTQQ